MLALELIAEGKIAEAAAQGEFDGLPGAGKPPGAGKSSRC